MTPTDDRLRELIRWFATPRTRPESFGDDVRDALLELLGRRATDGAIAPLPGRPKKFRGTVVGEAPE